MPGPSNPLYMTPEEIVAEISDHRDGIDKSSRRIYELSRVLRDRMRRADPTQAGVYVTYANTWTRFAGMIQQGLQRTRVADRVLRLLPDDEQNSRSRTRPEPEPQPQGEPVEDQAHTVPDDSPFRDFIDLYGEEVVRDADGQR